MSTITTTAAPSPPSPAIQQLNRDYMSLSDRLQELVDTRTRLASQLNENEGVRQELDLLKPGAELFRAIGPALVSSEVGEAKELVDGRMKKIKENLQTVENEFEKIGKQRQELVGKIQALQRQPEQQPSQ